MTNGGSKWKDQGVELRICLKDKGGAKKHSFTTHAKLKHDTIILNIHKISIELIEVVNFSNCLKGNYSVLLWGPNFSAGLWESSTATIYALLSPQY